MPSKKEKGQAFERELARAFGRWWCGDPDAFWRTSGSGARAKRAGIHFLDIAPIKLRLDEAPFCIEAKNRKNWSFAPILEDHASGSSLWAYWDKAIQETCPGCLMLLVFKGLRTATWVMLSFEDHARLSSRDWLHDLFTGRTRIFPAQRPVVIVKLDDFFATVTRELVLEHYGLVNENFPAALRPQGSAA